MERGMGWETKSSGASFGCFHILWIPRDGFDGFLLQEGKKGYLGTYTLYRTIKIFFCSCLLYTKGRCMAYGLCGVLLCSFFAYNNILDISLFSGVMDMDTDTDTGNMNGGQGREGLFVLYVCGNGGRSFLWWFEWN